MEKEEPRTEPAQTRMDITQLRTHKIAHTDAQHKQNKDTHEHTQTYTHTLARSSAATAYHHRSHIRTHLSREGCSTSLEVNHEPNFLAQALVLDAEHLPRTSHSFRDQHTHALGAGTTSHVYA